MSNSHGKSVFISYSHKDEKYKTELLTMLKPLRDKGIFNVWHDRMIDAGDSWNEEIERELNSCQMAILLISPDSLASNYIKKELRILLQRRRTEDVLVIPVILDDCVWNNIEELAQIQALPRDGRPVRSFERRTVAWREIAEHLLELHRKSVQKKHKQDELEFQRRVHEVRREQEIREEQQRIILTKQFHGRISRFFLLVGFILIIYMTLPKQNVSSYPTDFEILQQLENSLGWKLLPLQDIQSNSFGGYQLNSNNELIGLGLSNFALTEIPQEIFRFRKLNRLYLGDNQLTSLPENIGNLSQLKILYLRNNKLISIPDNIRRLSQLQTLDLGNNQLTDIPKEIKPLNQLQELYLDKNPLRTPQDHIVRQGMPSVMQFLREQ